MCTLLIFLQCVPVYFLTYRDCGSEFRMLSNCPLFLVSLCAEPTTCRDNDAVRMWAVSHGCKRRFQFVLVFPDLLLCLFTGFCAPGSLSMHLLGEPRQCFMSCVYSVSVWWYVWRVPRMCVFSLVCECVCICVFFTGVRCRLSVLKGARQLPFTAPGGNKQ